MCGLLQQKGDLQAYTPLGTPLLPNGGQKSVFTKALAAKPSPVFDNDSPEGNPPHPSSRSFSPLLPLPRPLWVLAMCSHGTQNPPCIMSHFCGLGALFDERCVGADK